MINIVSKFILRKDVSGPQKVVVNLIKGLDRIGYPYVVNKGLDSCKRLWIFDDMAALKYVSRLDPEIKTIVGNVLYLMPREIPRQFDLNRAVYIQPSQWVVDFWRTFGYDCGLMDVWPSGIDLSDFTPANEKKDIVLIYFKQRYPWELEMIKNLLTAKKIQYQIVYYGRYQESNYKKLLARTKYIIWLGRQESQGFALEEALAMNVPILISEVLCMGHWQASEQEMSKYLVEELAFAGVTAAPYFSDDCGIIWRDFSRFSEKIDEMEATYANYSPRKYIESELSLEKKANDFVGLYEKNFGLNPASGYQERLLNDKKWINDKICQKSFIYLKNIVKSSLNNIKK